MPGQMEFDFIIDKNGIQDLQPCIDEEGSGEWLAIDPYGCNPFCGFDPVTLSVAVLSF